MMIEFYGLPGSGKTTAARKKAEAEDFQIIKIRSNKELFFYNLAFLFKNPAFFLKTFFKILRNSKTPRIFYYKLMNSFFHYNAKYMKAGRYKRAILDQSFFQNILSIFDRVLSEDELRAIVKSFPKPDGLIVFDLPEEERQRRVKERGYLGRETLGEDASRWEAIMRGNHELFLKILEGEKNLNFKIIRD